MAVENICFEYRVNWPLGIVFSLGAVQKYQAITSLLVKLRMVSGRIIQSLARGEGREKMILRFQMNHFLQALQVRFSSRAFLSFLHSPFFSILSLADLLVFGCFGFQSYIFDFVIDTTWKELIESLDDILDLDELVQLHHRALDMILNRW